MTPDDRERLAAVEQQLADAVRELHATRAHLSVLRAMLADDGGPAVDTISSAGESATARPTLRVLEGGRSGERRRAQGGNRHGLRAV